jgi:archaellum component FlaG (FlaF/FlaG flagellin family)
MKKILLSLPLIFAIACDSVKSKELITSSADSSYQIKVSGIKPIALDPFTAEIIINGNNRSDTLMTQIYASELNEETVRFTWSDSTNCLITFKQTDGEKKMEVSFSNGTNSYREIQ